MAEIWSRLSPALRALAGSPTRLEQLRAGWLNQYGHETKVLEERTDSLAGVRRYLRVAKFSNASGPIEIPWSFDEKNQIITLGLGRLVGEALDANAGREAPVSLRLPFDGEWTVWWGGRTIWENFHAASTDRRFAADFFIVKDGRTHAGEGTRNEDYFAFGKEVLAPAAGTVVSVHDGQPDNAPGRVDPHAEPDGNVVVLDLDNRVYAFFAHLQNGSIAVKAGQRVKTGELLAKAGNSGRSTQPCLHVHLQDAAESGKGSGWRLVFHGVVVNGAPAATAEPVRGQRLAPRVRTAGSTPR
jgi:murein DD-endopeptidase MepM/ murein hydrolase activator NlpD